MQHGGSRLGSRATELPYTCKQGFPQIQGVEMAGFKARHSQPMQQGPKELVKSGNAEKGSEQPIPPCYLFWPQTRSLWLESAPGWAEPRCQLGLAESRSDSQSFTHPHLPVRTVCPQ